MAHSCYGTRRKGGAPYLTSCPKEQVVQRGKMRWAEEIALSHLCASRQHRTITKLWWEADKQHHSPILDLSYGQGTEDIAQDIETTSRAVRIADLLSPDASSEEIAVTLVETPKTTPTAFNWYYYFKWFLQQRASNSLYFLGYFHNSNRILVNNFQWRKSEQTNLW